MIDFVCLHSRSLPSTSGNSDRIVTLLGKLIECVDTMSDEISEGAENRDSLVDSRCLTRVKVLQETGFRGCVWRWDYVHHVHAKVQPSGKVYKREDQQGRKHSGNDGLQLTRSVFSFLFVCPSNLTN